MNNSEKYRRAMDAYSDLIIREYKIIEAIQPKTRDYKKPGLIRRHIVAAATVVIILSIVTVAGAVTNWSYFADLFRNVFYNPKSAETVELGGIQELDIKYENDNLTLKLSAVTGDNRIHSGLFELILKQEISGFNRVKLIGQEFLPKVLERYISSDHYGFFDIASPCLVYTNDNSTFYFNYEFGRYWTKENYEDVVLYIERIEFYNGSKLLGSIDCDMTYQFTPDRKLMDFETFIAVNKFVTRNIFEYSSIYSSEIAYENTRVEIDTIVTPMVERTIQIDKVIVSKFDTAVYCTIKGETLKPDEAWMAACQFLLPNVVTMHFYDGFTFKDHYEMVSIKNVESIRLFVDDIEIPILKKDAFHSNSTKGYDEEGNRKKEYECSLVFEGFDYENAKSVELRAGDVVIPLK